MQHGCLHSCSNYNINGSVVLTIYANLGRPMQLNLHRLAIKVKEDLSYLDGKGLGEGDKRLRPVYDAASQNGIMAVV